MGIGAIEETTDLQKVKHLPSCLSLIAQEIMVPYLITFSGWKAVKEALISEFRNAKTLSNKEKPSF